MADACHHPDLHFHLNHCHFGNTNLHYVEVTATCNGCGAHMLFRGVPAGLLPGQPAASLDGRTASLPMLAEGEALTGNPAGYVVRGIEPDAIATKDGA